MTGMTWKLIHLRFFFFLHLLSVGIQLTARHKHPSTLFMLCQTSAEGKKKKKHTVAAPNLIIMPR